MIITSTTITILEFVCRDLRGAAFRGDHATVRRSRAEGAVESTGARACVKCASRRLLAARRLVAREGFTSKCYAQIEVLCLRL